MTYLRRVAVGLGAIGFVLALLVGFAGLDSLVTVDALVTLVGTDYTFVVVIAAGGFLVALATGLSARATGRFQTSVPDPERPFTAPIPGESFDEAVADWRAVAPVVGRDRRRTIRRRLRRTVVETVCHVDGCDARTALDLVETGRWTEDPWARSLLCPDERLSVERRLRALAGGDVPFRRQVGRTVAELERIDAERCRGEGERRDAVVT